MALRNICSGKRLRSAIALFIIYIMIGSMFSFVVFAQEPSDGSSDMQNTYDSDNPDSFDWADGDYSTVPWEDIDDFSRVDFAKVPDSAYDRIDWEDVDQDIYPKPRDLISKIPEDMLDIDAIEQKTPADLVYLTSAQIGEHLEEFSDLSELGPSALVGALRQKYGLSPGFGFAIAAGGPGSVRLDEGVLVIDGISCTDTESTLERCDIRLSDYSGIAGAVEITALTDDKGGFQICKGVDGAGIAGEISGSCSRLQGMDGIRIKHSDDGQILGVELFDSKNNQWIDLEGRADMAKMPDGRWILTTADGVSVTIIPHSAMTEVDSDGNRISSSGAASYEIVTADRKVRMDVHGLGETLFIFSEGRLKSFEAKKAAATLFVKNSGGDEIPILIDGDDYIAEIDILGRLANAGNNAKDTQLKVLFAGRVQRMIDPGRKDAFHYAASTGGQALDVLLLISKNAALEAAAEKIESEFSHGRKDIVFDYPAEDGSDPTKTKKEQFSCSSASSAQACVQSLYTQYGKDRITGQIDEMFDDSGSLVVDLDASHDQPMLKGFSASSGSITDARIGIFDLKGAGGVSYMHTAHPTDPNQIFAYAKKGSSGDIALISWNTRESAAQPSQRFALSSVGGAVVAKANSADILALGLDGQFDENFDPSRNLKVIGLKGGEMRYDAATSSFMHLVAGSTEDKPGLVIFMEDVYQKLAKPWQKQVEATEFIMQMFGQTAETVKEVLGDARQGFANYIDNVEYDLKDAAGKVIGSIFIEGKIDALDAKLDELDAQNKRNPTLSSWRKYSYLSQGGWQDRQDAQGELKGIYQKANSVQEKGLVFDQYFSLSYKEISDMTGSREQRAEAVRDAYRELDSMAGSEEEKILLKRSYVSALYDSHKAERESSLDQDITKLSEAAAVLEEIRGSISAEEYGNARLLIAAEKAEHYKSGNDMLQQYEQALAEAEDARKSLGTSVSEGALIRYALASIRLSKGMSPKDAAEDMLDLARDWGLSGDRLDKVGSQIYSEMASEARKISDNEMAMGLVEKSIEISGGTDLASTAQLETKAAILSATGQNLQAADYYDLALSRKVAETSFDIDKGVDIFRMFTDLSRIESQSIKNYQMVDGISPDAIISRGRAYLASTADRSELRSDDNDVRLAVGRACQAQGDISCSMSMHLAADSIISKFGDERAVSLESAQKERLDSQKMALAFGMAGDAQAANNAVLIKDAIRRLESPTVQAMMSDDQKKAALQMEKNLRLQYIYNAQSQTDYDSNLASLAQIISGGGSSVSSEQIISDLSSFAKDGIKAAWMEGVNEKVLLMVAEGALVQESSRSANFRKYNNAIQEAQAGILRLESQKGMCATESCKTDIDRKIRSLESQINTNAVWMQYNRYKGIEAEGGTLSAEQKEQKKKVDGYVAAYAAEQKRRRAQVEHNRKVAEAQRLQNRIIEINNWLDSYDGSDYEQAVAEREQALDQLDSIDIAQVKDAAKQMRFSIYMDMASDGNLKLLESLRSDPSYQDVVVNGLTVQDAHARIKYGGSAIDEYLGMLGRGDINLEVFESIYGSSPMQVEGHQLSGSDLNNYAVTRNDIIELARQGGDSLIVADHLLKESGFSFGEIGLQVSGMAHTYKQDIIVTKIRQAQSDADWQKLTQDWGDDFEISLKDGGQVRLGDVQQEVETLRKDRISGLGDSYDLGILGKLQTTAEGERAFESYMKMAITGNSAAEEIVLRNSNGRVFAVGDKSLSTAEFLDHYKQQYRLAEIGSMTRDLASEESLAEAAQIYVMLGQTSKAAEIDLELQRRQVEEKITEIKTKASKDSLEQAKFDDLWREYKEKQEYAQSQEVDESEGTYAQYKLGEQEMRYYMESAQKRLLRQQAEQEIEAESESEKAALERQLLQAALHSDQNVLDKKVSELRKIDRDDLSEPEEMQLSIYEAALEVRDAKARNEIGGVLKQAMAKRDAFEEQEVNFFESFLGIGDKDQLDSLDMKNKYLEDALRLEITSYGQDVVDAYISQNEPAEEKRIRQEMQVVDAQLASLYKEYNSLDDEALFITGSPEIDRISEDIDKLSEMKKSLQTELDSVGARQDSVLRIAKDVQKENEYKKKYPEMPGAWDLAMAGSMYDEIDSVIETARNNGDTATEQEFITKKKEHIEYSKGLLGFYSVDDSFMRKDAHGNTLVDDTAVQVLAKSLAAKTGYEGSKEAQAAVESYTDTGEGITGVVEFAWNTGIPKSISALTSWTGEALGYNIWTNDDVNEIISLNEKANDEYHLVNTLNKYIESTARGDGTYGVSWRTIGDQTTEQIEQNLLRMTGSKPSEGQVKAMGDLIKAAKDKKLASDEISVVDYSGKLDFTQDTMLDALTTPKAAVEMYLVSGALGLATRTAGATLAQIGKTSGSLAESVGFTPLSYAFKGTEVASKWTLNAAQKTAASSLNPFNVVNKVDDYVAGKISQSGIGRAISGSESAAVKFAGKTSADIARHYTFEIGVEELALPSVVENVGGSHMSDALDQLEMISGIGGRKGSIFKSTKTEHKGQIVDYVVVEDSLTDIKRKYDTAEAKAEGYKIEEVPGAVGNFGPTAVKITQPTGAVTIAAVKGSQYDKARPIVRDEGLILNKPDRSYVPVVVVEGDFNKVGTAIATVSNKVSDVELTTAGGIVVRGILTDDGNFQKLVVSSTGIDHEGILEPVQMKDQEIKSITYLEDGKRTKIEDLSGTADIAYPYAQTYIVEDQGKISSMKDIITESLLKSDDPDIQNSIKSKRRGLRDFFVNAEAQEVFSLSTYSDLTKSRNEGAAEVADDIISAMESDDYTQGIVAMRRIGVLDEEYEMTDAMKEGMPAIVASYADKIRRNAVLQESLAAAYVEAGGILAVSPVSKLIDEETKEKYLQEIKKKGFIPGQELVDTAFLASKTGDRKEDVAGLSPYDAEQLGTLSITEEDIANQKAAAPQAIKDAENRQDMSQEEIDVKADYYAALNRLYNQELQKILESSDVRGTFEEIIKNTEDALDQVAVGKLAEDIGQIRASDSGDSDVLLAIEELVRQRRELQLKEMIRNRDRGDVFEGMRARQISEISILSSEIDSVATGLSVASADELNYKLAEEEYRVSRLLAGDSIEIVNQDLLTNNGVRAQVQERAYYIGLDGVGTIQALAREKAYTALLLGEQTNIIRDNAGTEDIKTDTISEQKGEGLDRPEETASNIILGSDSVNNIGSIELNTQKFKLHTSLKTEKGVSGKKVLLSKDYIEGVFKQTVCTDCPLEKIYGEQYCSGCILSLSDSKDYYEIRAVVGGNEYEIVYTDGSEYMLRAIPKVEDTVTSVPQGVENTNPNIKREEKQDAQKEIIKAPQPGRLRRFATGVVQLTAWLATAATSTVGSSIGGSVAIGLFWKGWYSMGNLSPVDLPTTVVFLVGFPVSIGVWQLVKSGLQKFGERFKPKPAEDPREKRDVISASELEELKLHLAGNPEGSRLFSRLSQNPIAVARQGSMQYAVDTPTGIIYMTAAQIDDQDLQDDVLLVKIDNHILKTTGRDLNLKSILDQNLNPEIGTTAEEAEHLRQQEKNPVSLALISHILNHPQKDQILAQLDSDYPAYAQATDEEKAAEIAAKIVADNYFGDLSSSSPIGSIYYEMKSLGHQQQKLRAGALIGQMILAKDNPAQYQKFKAEYEYISKSLISDHKDLARAGQLISDAQAKATADSIISLIPQSVRSSVDIEKIAKAISLQADVANGRLADRGYDQHEEVAYHDFWHADDMATITLRSIDNVPNTEITPRMYELMILAAFAHDAGYYRKSELGTLRYNHEERSKEFVRTVLKDELGLSDKDVSMIDYMIDATKFSTSPIDIEQNKADIPGHDLKDPADFNDIYTASWAAAFMAAADVYAHPQNKMAQVIALHHEFSHDAQILDALEQTPAVVGERKALPVAKSPLAQTASSQGFYFFLSTILPNVPPSGKLEKLGVLEFVPQDLEQRHSQNVAAFAEFAKARKNIAQSSIDGEFGVLLSEEDITKLEQAGLDLDFATPDAMGADIENFKQRLRQALLSTQALRSPAIQSLTVILCSPKIEQHAKTLSLDESDSSIFYASLKDRLVQNPDTAYPVAVLTSGMTLANKIGGNEFGNYVKSWILEKAGQQMSMDVQGQEGDYAYLSTSVLAYLTPEQAQALADEFNLHFRGLDRDGNKVRPGVLDTGLGFVPILLEHEADLADLRLNIGMTDVRLSEHLDSAAEQKIRDDPSLTPEQKDHEILRLRAMAAEHVAVDAVDTALGTAQWAEANDRLADDKRIVTITRIADEPLTFSYAVTGQDKIARQQEETLTPEQALAIGRTKSVPQAIFAPGKENHGLFPRINHDVGAVTKALDDGTLTWQQYQDFMISSLKKPTNPRIFRIQNIQEVKDLFMSGAIADKAVMLAQGDEIYVLFRQGGQVRDMYIEFNWFNKFNQDFGFDATDSLYNLILGRMLDYVTQNVRDDMSDEELAEVLSSERISAEIAGIDVSDVTNPATGQRWGEQLNKYSAQPMTTLGSMWFQPTEKYSGAEEATGDPAVGDRLLMWQKPDGNMMLSNDRVMMEQEGNSEYVPRHGLTVAATYDGRVQMSGLGAQERFYELGIANDLDKKAAKEEIARGSFLDDLSVGLYPDLTGFMAGQMSAAHGYYKDPLTGQVKGAYSKVIRDGRTYRVVYVQKGLLADATQDVLYHEYDHFSLDYLRQVYGIDTAANGLYDEEHMLSVLAKRRMSLELSQEESAMMRYLGYEITQKAFTDENGNYLPQTDDIVARYLYGSISFEEFRAKADKQGILDEFGIESVVIYDDFYTLDQEKKPVPSALLRRLNDEGASFMAGHGRKASVDEELADIERLVQGGVGYDDVVRAHERLKMHLQALEKASPGPSGESMVDKYRPRLLNLLVVTARIASDKAPSDEEFLSFAADSFYYLDELALASKDDSLIVKHFDDISANVIRRYFENGIDFEYAAEILSDHAWILYLGELSDQSMIASLQQARQVESEISEEFGEISADIISADEESRFHPEFWQGLYDRFYSLARKEQLLVIYLLKVNDQQMAGLHFRRMLMFFQNAGYSLSDIESFLPDYGFAVRTQALDYSGRQHYPLDNAGMEMLLNFNPPDSDAYIARGKEGIVLDLQGAIDAEINRMQLLEEPSGDIGDLLDTGQDLSVGHEQEDDYQRQPSQSSLEAFVDEIILQQGGSPDDYVLKIFDPDPSMESLVQVGQRLPHIVEDHNNYYGAPSVIAYAVTDWNKGWMLIEKKGKDDSRLVDYGMLSPTQKSVAELYVAMLAAVMARDGMGMQDAHYQNVGAVVRDGNVEEVSVVDMGLTGDYSATQDPFAEAFQMSTRMMWTNAYTPENYQTSSRATYSVRLEIDGAEVPIIMVYDNYMFDTEITSPIDLVYDGKVFSERMIEIDDKVAIGETTIEVGGTEKIVSIRFDRPSGPLTLTVDGNIETIEFPDDTELESESGSEPDFKDELTPRQSLAEGLSTCT